MRPGPRRRTLRPLCARLHCRRRPIALLQPASDAVQTFTAPLAQGGTARLSPFYSLYDRRSAVYASLFTPARWSQEGQAFLAAENRRIDLARRTLDTVYLGEQQPEVDHGVVAHRAEIIQINGRSGRRIAGGGRIDLRLTRRDNTPTILRLVYWGEDIGQRGQVLLDDAPLAEIHLPEERHDGFRTLDIALPAGPSPAVIAVEARQGDLALYEISTLTPPDEGS